jgi:hypothetical protein
VLLKWTGAALKGGSHIVDGQDVLHAEFARRREELVLVSAPWVALAHHAAEPRESLRQSFPLGMLIMALGWLYGSRISLYQQLCSL